jgi:gliding motility-associated lipoprotein GldH
MKNIYLCACLATLLITTSCSSATYEKYDKNSFVNYIWNKEQQITFNPTIEDADKPYVLTIGIRHIHGVPYDNLGVNVKSISPSGRESSRAYTISIKDADQKFKANCAGDLCDLETVVEESITFPEAGPYTYIVTHTYRSDQVPGIMSVGLIIKEKK